MPPTFGLLTIITVILASLPGARSSLKSGGPARPGKDCLTFKMAFRPVIKVGFEAQKRPACFAGRKGGFTRASQTSSNRTLEAPGMTARRGLSL